MGCGLRAVTLPWPNEGRESSEEIDMQATIEREATKKSTYRVPQRQDQSVMDSDRRWEAAITR